MRCLAARVIFAAVGFGLAFGVCAQGVKLSSNDASFILQATSAGMNEVELSRIAAKNSSTSGVKMFAKRMVEDHEKAGKELSMIGGRLGAVPPKPMSEPAADIRRFGELKGEMLDKAYVGKMVDGHKGAIALFEKQAKGADADELKQFASKVLPMLKEHLKMALALAEKGK